MVIASGIADFERQEHAFHGKVDQLFGCAFEVLVGFHSRREPGDEDHVKCGGRGAPPFLRSVFLKQLQSDGQ